MKDISNSKPVAGTIQTANCLDKSPCHFESVISNLPVILNTRYK